MVVRRLCVRCLSVSTIIISHPFRARLFAFRCVVDAHEGSLSIVGDHSLWERVTLGEGVLHHFQYIMYHSLSGHLGHSGQTLIIFHKSLKFFLYALTRRLSTDADSCLFPCQLIKYLIFYNPLHSARDRVQPLFHLQFDRLCIGLPFFQQFLRPLQTPGI